MTSERTRSLRPETGDIEITFAYVNQGRWVVDCRDCNSSWIVRPEIPSRLIDAKGGLHDSCNCGAVIIVQFPAQKAEIDELLELRPHAVNRNWRSGETVFDLRIENAAHGVGGA